MSNANKNCLYYLRDPRNGEIFYVGIGKPARPFVHLGAGKKLLATGGKRKGRYIRICELLELGLEHIVEIVKTDLTNDEACELEIAEIARLGRADQDKGVLLNRTAGGQWIADCPKSDEWKAQMSVVQKEIQNRPEIKAAKSAALKGRKRTEEQRENIRQAQLKIRDTVSEKRQGGGNPAAKKCEVDGVVYGCLTDAARALGLGDKPWQLRSKFKVTML